MKWKTLATAAAFALSTLPATAQTYDLKVATFVTGAHGMSKWIDAWAAGLTEQSEGRLQFEILHGAQMGPPPVYYDLARNGQADIVWHLHGATPGRFELTEISNMPFLFCSAEQATMVLNDARLRSEYLDAEHRGVKVLALFMHPPGQIISNAGPILTLDDMAGKGLRPASSAVVKFIAAMGGTPVGLPPTEMAEALQKGTIQGALIDYGGAALAFGLAPHLTDVTEVYSYTSSFMLGMNPDSFSDLPDDLQAMVEASLAGVSDDIGQVWDGMDIIGKNVLIEAGVTIHTLDDAGRAALVEVGNSVTDGYVAELEADGKPGAAVLAMMRMIADEVGPVGAGCAG